MIHNLLRKSTTLTLVVIALLCLLLSACTTGPTPSQTGGNGSGTTITGGASQPSFPTTPLTLRTPDFGSAGKVAPTVKVLASADPTLIIQFPLFPSGIKSKFPNATGLVTVFQDTRANDFDTVTVNVQNM